MAKNETRKTDSHKLVVAVARESCTNQAIAFALLNDGYMDLAEVYDSLAQALSEYEAEVHMGLELKPQLPE